MTRNRRSARQAGARFESLVATYLADTVDDRIERRRLSGSKDRGDIGGVRHLGKRVVIECKDTSRWSPAEWLREAEVARGNDDAVAGIVVAKRRGVADPGKQVVLLTLADLVALLAGERPDEHDEEATA